MQDPIPVVVALTLLVGAGCNPCVDADQAKQLKADGAARHLTALDAALVKLGLTRVDLQLSCAASAPSGEQLLPTASTVRGWCHSGAPQIVSGYQPFFARDAGGATVPVKELPREIGMEQHVACGCGAGVSGGIPPEDLKVSALLPAGSATGPAVSVAFDYLPLVVTNEPGANCSAP